MTNTPAAKICYDPKGRHQEEAVYSTPFSSLLGLHDANKFIHSIPSLPYLVEFIVFLFGYAFNPVSIPFCMLLATMTGCLPFSKELASDQSHIFFSPTFYLATVLVTLIGTEVCKISFRASRPEAILSPEFRNSGLRRFGELVGSLKSKHSFPSGDSAQAANAVLFWFYYIAPLWKQQHRDENILALCHFFAFGVFFPGVAFARIFYHCHWIEDCLAGAVLATVLHCTVMPTVSDLVWDVADRYVPRAF